MHQTIFGEIPKNILYKDDFKNFFKSEEIILNNEVKNCLYDNLNLIKNPVLNYLNITTEEKPNMFLKNLLRKDFDNLESYFSYLGNLYIEKIFDKKNIKNTKKIKFNKKNYKLFLKSLNDKKVKEIGRFLFSKSKEYSIFIEHSHNKDTVIECKKEINFKLPFENFDYDKRFIELKNYKFLIIDGYIESIGEIHHLLQKSAEDKESYVIFCFGMSEEVKQTILTNNKRKITNIFPISLKVVEETLNILNDIAVIHNSDIVSALKGETISQSMRKKLPVGKKIIIKKENFIIEPVCSEETLSMHRNFLIKKISNIVIAAENSNKSIDIIKKRIRNLTPKTIKIFLNNEDIKDKNFLNELDYLLRFIKDFNKDFVQIKTNFRNSIYYFPAECINLINDKINSTTSIIEKIDVMILRK